MQKAINWLLKEKHFGKATKNFYNDVKRLEAGEPLDYIIGFTEFLGCKIDLSKKPLIPRSETEYWVGETIKHISPSASSGRALRVLDIFSGSGCIGCALVKKFKKAKVTFVDKQENCVKQIKTNLKTNKLKGKVIKSDIFNKVTGKYNYIFANPPYIPDYKTNPSARLRAIQKNRIQKSVLKYEPQKALFGGNDGLFYVKKFLKEAPKYLKKNGMIFMEFSPEQKKDIEKIIKQNKYSNFKFNKDQYNRWRWVVVFK